MVHIANRCPHLTRCRVGRCVRFLRFSLPLPRARLRMPRGSSSGIRISPTPTTTGPLTAADSPRTTSSTLTPYIQDASAGPVTGSHSSPSALHCFPLRDSATLPLSRPFSPSLRSAPRPRVPRPPFIPSDSLQMPRRH
ncbi:hypothetical protein L226DRAFT_42572 [Lentinus tigrinus ALCF2SS1-7]|uniref:uncharacterized protein n=1 Tax=Lentinus tigrinus ALCF2SS1-7 TaxID=1328758 RepID=UPI0011662C1F|nr:hypothetical protein L226DRAFT_42572 [Lentinus tigrinus ALCF2SS1-7]